MNIVRPVIPSEVKESRERPYEILRLRRGFSQDATSAPGRPETGTKDRTSRAMNTLRRLLPFV
jgi:hypothetical protein